MDHFFDDGISFISGLFLQAEQEPLAQSKQSQSTATDQHNGYNFNTYDNPEQQNTSDAWVLNTSTMKIHHPKCNDVKKIAPDNYATSNSSLEELRQNGYSECGHCFKK